MAKQRTAVQVNQFIGGFNTEANPLSFPENSSIDECNMELNTRGIRVRRNGFDVEPSHNVLNTGVTYSTTAKLGRSQFRWENPSGSTVKHFLVVQIGNYLAVHDADAVPISTTPVYSFTFNTSTYSTDFSYAEVEGNLVVATGLKTPSVLSYDGTTVTKTDVTLFVRDFWGVQAPVSGPPFYTDPANVSLRPASLGSAHLYNLRNQTFALPRMEGASDVTTLVDPIARFVSFTSTYPANADSIIPHLIADANKTTNRTVERFNVGSMYAVAPSNSFAPKGYFIIDALERGVSRVAQEAALRSRNPTLSLSVTSLVADTTPGGPVVTASYAGRAWFAGFSGLVSGGDAQSPHLDSYVLFSQQVQSKSNIGRCYQEGDPTSQIDPDIVDTDGGFVKIEGVAVIRAMVPLGTSLFILADNGVWKLSGIDDNSFTATGYSLSKITSSGCISAQSVVAVPNGILYWGTDGIYIISQDDAGSWVSQNITRTTIQTFYDELSDDNKQSAVGYYDIQDPSVRWLYGNGLQLRQGVEELIFNLKYQAFTKNEVGSVSEVFGPLSAVGGSNRITSTFRRIIPKKSFYLIITSPTATIQYTFGGYKDATIMDWTTWTGIDVPAYILAATANQGSSRLKRGVPYLSMFLEHTQDQDSSCIVQAQWDWTKDSLTNRWSQPREAYRPQRLGTGETMVTTRNRIRGNGKSVAFKMSSSTNKPLTIYGWEFNVEASTEE